MIITMQEELKKFITDLIELTFGFTPTVNITALSDNNTQVFIQGNEEERAILMGKSAQTLKAITRLTIVFAKRHKFWVHIYIQPRETTIDY